MYDKNETIRRGERIVITINSKEITGYPQVGNDVESTTLD